MRRFVPYCLLLVLSLLAALETRAVALAKVDGVAEYRYDVLHRRISKLLPNGSNWDRTDYYHNNNWQVLEERTSVVASATTPATQPHIQWVWGTQYIDTPIRRVRDVSGNGTWSETLYYTTDANMNVTALVDTAGNVVERVTYDTYGKPTFYAGTSFAAPAATSAYANEILFAGYRYDSHLGIYHVRFLILCGDPHNISYVEFRIMWSLSDVTL